MVDLLVLGATGYTGKLIAHYLSTHRERDTFKLGLAGRSQEKLNQLVSDLNVSDIRTYTVDVTDDESIKTLLHDSQAKVVLTTVGPFYRLGKPIARGCAQNGVHYVDINGEVPFVMDLIEELDTVAVKTNAVMIPSAAFDSVPSDAIAYLSALTLQSALKSMSGDQDLENVGVEHSHTMLKAKVGLGGGSVASVANMVEVLPLKKLMESQAPDALSPIKLPSRQGTKLVYSMPAAHPKRFGHFFFLVPHNVAIVHRTRALFQLNADKFKPDDGNAEDAHPVYAENFTYEESWEASNRFTAFIISLGWLLGTCFFVFPPCRWLAKRLLPAGQGPSDNVLEKGWLEMDNISISASLPETGKHLVVESHLHGRGEPAYALTAVTASEVALSLVLTPREKLPTLARQGGVLTPMSGLGSILLKRLSASGKFEFESELRDE